MGGNGTIGGGKSFLLHVNTEDKTKKAKSAVEASDEDVTYPFTIYFTFPDGTKKDAVINSKQDQVTFNWS